MQTTQKIGPYAVRIDYDDDLGLFAGVVADRPYGVRLTAPTREALVERFECLLLGYIGVEAA